MLMANISINPVLQTFKYNSIMWRFNKNLFRTELKTPNHYDQSFIMFLSSVFNIKMIPGDCASNMKQDSSTHFIFRLIQNLF